MGSSPTLRSNTMKPSKNELIDLELLRRNYTEAWNEYQSYRKFLAQTCEHPPEVIVGYRWEHDNGYGRQTMIDGKGCSICLAKDHWNRGVFSK